MWNARNRLRSGTASAASGSPRGAVLAALESLPVPVVLVDAREQIVFINQHVVHDLGFATAELVGQPLSLLVPDTQRGRGWPTLAEVLRRERQAVTSIEARARHKDGTMWTVSIDAGLLELDGVALALCLLHEAVAHAGNADASVAASLKEAQHLAKLGSWTWDMATGKHTWSDELYRMLEIDPADPNPFERYRAMIHRNDRAWMDEGATRIARGDDVEPFDVRVVLPSGARRIFHSEGAATTDADGRVSQLHGTLQDVTELRATETALRLTEMRYREAQRLAKIGNWEWDLATNTSWWSDELYRILEEDRAVYAATFEHFIAKVHPDDRQVLIDGQKNIAVGSNAYAPTESRLVMADGREKRIEQLVEARVDSQGRPIAIVGTVHDITERRQLESKLRESEARYASTVELAAVGIAHVAGNGRFIWCNRRLREMLGYDYDELMTLTIKDVSHPDDMHVTDVERSRMHEGVIDTLTIEKRYIRKDSATIWARITAAPRRAANQSLLYDVAVVEDITVRKAAEDKVQYLATHDEMTGLPNRTLFAELLQHAIEGARRHDRRCAVLFIDLDRFKVVNDSLGHEAGDVLLQEVAARLRRCIRSSDVVARLGGDEFVVLLDQIHGIEAAAESARRILVSLHAPITVTGHECRVTGSIGIATYPNDARDAATLMKQADMAMYLAKDEGKNNFQFYSADMTPMSVEHLELEVRLAQALQRNEFSLQYQPRVDIGTGEILGAEALLRWWNPDLGTMSPAQFIPLAEDTGLIVAIGQWVLRSACEQNVAWQKRGLRKVVMSVNLSPRQFKEAALLSDIAGALAETGMAPELLELEITESMIMQHVDIAAEKAAAMKKLGVRLAIDDFGTGYSSLSQLSRFPIDTLKIDRAFVRDIPLSEDDTAITKAVVSLGKALGVRVVAEGVETQEQYRFLRDNGCDEMQGFYFSKPCHPDAFADLLKSSNKRAPGGRRQASPGRTRRKSVRKRR